MSKFFILYSVLLTQRQLLQRAFFLFSIQIAIDREEKETEKPELSASIWFPTGYYPSSADESQNDPWKLQVINLFLMPFDTFSNFSPFSDKCHNFFSIFIHLFD